MLDADALVRVLDLAGTFVFALSGGLLAAERRFDLVGVVVLSVAAGCAGGMIRDVLLDRPPVALEGDEYLLTGLAAAALVAVAGRAVARGGPAVAVLDAGGLALFVVVGTQVALAEGTSVLVAVTMGVITGAGGGVVRDVLAQRTPLVLEREVYVVPAVLGGLVVAAGDAAGADGTLTALVGAGAVLVVRLLSLWRRWSVPRPRPTTA